MTTLIQAAEQALAAMEKCKAALAEELDAWDIDPPLHHILESHNLCAPAITALRQALALEKMAENERELGIQMRPADEPVARVVGYYAGRCVIEPLDRAMVMRDNMALYAHPQPKREWLGLTDEEMRELERQFEAERVRTSDEEYLVIYPAAYWQWQNAIEAKLKEKNHG